MDINLYIQLTLISMGKIYSTGHGMHIGKYSDRTPPQRPPLMTRVASNNQNLYSKVICAETVHFSGIYVYATLKDATEK